MNPRIVGACIGGLALVVTAYYFSNLDQAVPLDGSLAVVAGQAPDRTYIESKDSNQDGVPDWQEALRSTEPLIIDQATTTFEVPDTITDQFAVEFFESFVRSKSAGPFGNSNEEIASNAVARLEAQTREEIFGPEDILEVTTSEQTNLQIYGNKIATIITTGYVQNTKNEAEITLDAIRSQDKTKLAALDEKIVAYQNFVDQMLNLTVPQGFLQSHLNLTNSFNAVLNDIRAMQSAFEDPLGALVRLQRYQEDVQALSISLDQLLNQLKEAGVTSYSLE